MLKRILSSCGGLFLMASFCQAALADQALAPGTVYRDCADCPEMVAMPTPAGFIMGSLLSDPNHLESERPRHSTRIAYGLSVSRFEVTRQEFALFAAEVGIAPPAGCKAWDKKAGDWVVDENLSWQDPGFAQSERDPVVCVSWELAIAYADWLGGKTGKSYRLLSESEWEWVARAGSDAINPWGNATESACRHANMADYSAADEWGASKDAKEGIFHCDDGAPFTAPVGSYQANAFGLFDMQGNAREWTLDCWHESYKDAPRDGSARYDGYCERRSVRGGSWLNYIPEGRIARRIGPTIAIGDTSTGFRLAVSN